MLSRGRIILSLIFVTSVSSVLDSCWLELDKSAWGLWIVPICAFDHPIIALDDVRDFELTCLVIVEAEADGALRSIDLYPTIATFF